MICDIGIGIINGIAALFMLGLYMPVNTISDIGK